MRRRTRAAPWGLRRRCSQLRRVAGLMPRRAENLCWERPNRSRIAQTSGSSSLNARLGLAAPFKIRPPSLMLSANSSKSSFFICIFHISLHPQRDTRHEEITGGHSGLHRQHVSAGLAQDRPEKRRADFVEDRKRESDR